MEYRNPFFEEELFKEEDEDEDILKDKYLTFRMENEDYALDVSVVTEIIAMHEITHLPDMPNYVRGVVNIRGRVIPVMDVRLRVRMEERAYDNRTCIIIVDVHGMHIGLIVDRVSEVTLIPPDVIETRPVMASRTRDQFIFGMGKVEGKVIIMFDVNKLVRENDIAVIAQVSAPDHAQA